MLDIVNPKAFNPFNTIASLKGALSGEYINNLFSPNRYRKELNEIMKSSGAGSFTNQLQVFLTSIDRYSKSMLPTNREHSGLTFITRPKLNFSSSSLRQSSKMSTLDSYNNASIAFMIRCLLDTKFSQTYSELSSSSPLLNIKNPFLTPVCNGLVAITGYPDPIIQESTTEGGYHSEDLTYAIGSDRHYKSHELMLTFKDIQNGPISAIFEYWLEYITNVNDGTQIAYKEDIDMRRINYSVSIYRFVLDPTRRYITKYAKSTGCWPKSLPLGAMFNMNENELTVQSSAKFSIPFKANITEYNVPDILVDFRTLVKRYCSNIESLSVIPPYAKFNYHGIPWVETTENGIELQFRG